MSELPTLPEPGDDPEMDAFAARLHEILLAPASLDVEAGVLWEEAREAGLLD